MNRGLAGTRRFSPSLRSRARPRAAASRRGRRGSACRARANDWCSVELTTDIFAANGKHTTIPVSVPSDPPVDCFYVYPTVSEEHRGNADLKLQPEERETAITQAARFSHVCRVYAPLYRQTTAYGYEYGGSP